MVGPLRQRTFDLVPETLVPKSAPKKPMTLKQAKKAAAAATKGPRMSRAERARLEKEELDRQRKEREKLRASEKAKQAREKKATKLAEEKACRKKMGIPEPSKFVRASQPTISGFVTAGFKRRRTESGRTESGSVEDGNESRASSVDSGVLEPTGGEELAVPGESLMNGDGRDYSTTSVLPGGKGPAVEEQASDPALTPTSHLFQANVSGNLNSPAQTSAIKERPQAAKEDNLASPIRTETKNNLRIMCTKGSEDSDEFDDDAELFAAMAATDVGTEANVRDRNTKGSSSRLLQNRMPPPPLPEKRIAKTSELSAAAQRPPKGPNFARSNAPHQRTKSADIPPEHRYSTNDGRRPLADRPKNMPPPALPSKWPSHPASALSTSLARKQAFSKTFPPSSTQAFLSDNLENFFPSPSQELRELQAEEKVRGSVNRGEQVHDRQGFLASPSSFGGRVKGLLAEPLLDNLADLFPSPSQEMRDLRQEEEVARRVPFHSSSSSMQHHDAPSRDHDVRELDVSNLDRPIVTDKKPSDHSDDKKKKPKSRFFTEKEEDIAASLQSLKQGTTVTSGGEKPARKREFSRTISKSSDYEDGEFDWNSLEVDEGM